MIYYLAGRESLYDAIMYYNNATAYWPYPGVQHRRISGIPVYNNTTGNNDWQLYQPFVLHTTDEFPLLYAQGNQQPSHAIAFRTIDQTERNTQGAPFYNQNSYGGGKLGVYSFWNTVGAANNGAPIVGIYNNSSAPVQYEFYNFSPSRNNGNANPQEVGNEVYTDGSFSELAIPYIEDFYNTGNNNGATILNELYYLNTGGSNSDTIQQVQVAIQTAFNNYISYLECANQMTGANGAWNNNANNSYCVPYQA